MGRNTTWAGVVDRKKSSDLLSSGSLVVVAVEVDVVGVVVVVVVVVVVTVVVVVEVVVVVVVVVVVCMFNGLMCDVKTGVNALCSPHVLIVCHFSCENFSMLQFTI